MTERSAGILCHVSSLWGKYGIGSLGKEAYRFAKILAKNGVKYWQILPLVQTGFGDSPYQSVSCDSGNPYFIDLETLKKEGLLTKEELKAAERKGEVDYASLYAERYDVLRTAYSRFFFDDPDFRSYVKSGASEDYALFMTAKQVYGGRFCDWSEELKRRDADALEALRTDHHEEYLFWQFTQYEFRKQWFALKGYCNGLGIKIMGDLPLYVAYDSADVWAHAELFKLDKDLKPVKVAGVPPDYFSEDGQLWGNPVYDWRAHEKEGFSWWKNRLRGALETFDAIRIDHFRGIDRYYEVDADAETAKKGVWQEGPKEKLFTGVSGEIVAEDLGTIYAASLTPEEFILFRSRVAGALEAAGIMVPLKADGKSFCDGFMHLALASEAKLAVLPIQDVLGLSNEARMNRPGTCGGNWRFRLECAPSARAMKKLKKAICKYRR